MEQKEFQKFLDLRIKRYTNSLIIRNIDYKLDYNDPSYIDGVYMKEEAEKLEEENELLTSEISVGYKKMNDVTQQTFNKLFQIAKEKMDREIE